MVPPSYKFVPTLILINGTMGHSVMPKAPNEDYIAFNDDKLIKVLKESELAKCRKLGTTFLWLDRRHDPDEWALPGLSDLSRLTWNLEALRI